MRENRMRMKDILKYFLFAVLVFLQLGSCCNSPCTDPPADNTTTSSTNTAQPTTTNWGFNYIGDVDTRGWATIARDAQTNLGYLPALLEADSNYSGNLAREVRNSTSNSAIVFFPAHGGILNKNAYTPVEAKNHTVLTLPGGNRIVTGINTPTGYKNFNVEFLQDADFSDSKFVLFLSCNSVCGLNATDCDEREDLVRTSISYGYADYAMGFYGCIKAPGQFTNYFWDAVQTESTIGQAASDAVESVCESFKPRNCQFMDTMRIFKSNNLPDDFSLTPASYGSQ